MGEQVSAADSQSEDTGTSKPLMQWPPPDPTRGRHRGVYLCVGKCVCMRGTDVYIPAPVCQ